MNTLLNWNAIQKLKSEASFPGKGLDPEQSNQMWSRVSIDISFYVWPGKRIYTTSSRIDVFG